jgi:hypothetical protein
MRGIKPTTVVTLTPSFVKKCVCVCHFRTSLLFVSKAKAIALPNVRLFYMPMYSICTKKLLVRVRSSLLVTIVFKSTKHFNYLQAYLQQTQTYL